MKPNLRKSVLALLLCLSMLLSMCSVAAADEELSITTQPKTVAVAEGKTATVTFTASGEDLTYEWYYKDAGSSSFRKTSTFTGNTYTVTMTEARNGRQIYCKVTDGSGNSVTTNTVTLKMTGTLALTSIPKSVTVPEGETAKVSFTATGDGLTYEWYYKDAGSSSFRKTSTFTGNTYTAVMTEARNGRQVYCKVTDVYGNPQHRSHHAHDEQRAEAYHPARHRDRCGGRNRQGFLHRHRRRPDLRMVL